MKCLRRSAVKRALTLVFLSAAFLAISVSVDPESTLAQKLNRKQIDLVLSGSITGRVFQDFNGNATFDTTTTIPNDGLGTIGVAIDRGVQNVEVRAYDAFGANVTTGGVAITDVAGIYTLVTNDAGSGPYRLEFTALPAGFSPSARSTDSVDGGSATNAGSAVQFTSAPAANVNLAVNYPADYSQNNPEVVAAVYASGDQISGAFSDTGVLESFPYSSGSNDTGGAANVNLYDTPVVNPLQIVANELGPAYGLAYARGTRLIYAAAHFKRHVGFGPQGPNAIYVISRTGTGLVTSTFNVPGTATNLHQTADYQRDNGNTGWNAVGKSSLGGMAMSEDEASLFVYNLADRSLHKLNTSNGVQTAIQSTLPTPPLPSGTCPAADVRPFSLTVYRNQLYAGFVCSAESSATVDTFTDANANSQYDAGDYYIESNGTAGRQAAEPYLNLNGTAGYQAGETFVDNDGNQVYNLGDARNLRAYVYTVNQTTLAYGAAPLFQAALNYPRGLGQRSVGAFNAWRPWSATYRNANSTGNRTVYAQPMLTDIAFDNGNLILAIRDRVTDQVGNGTLSNPSDPSNVNLYQPRGGSDILRACGAIAAWTLENNGRCAGNGTAPQNTGEGPGNGEFYHGDAFTLSTTMTLPATVISGKGSNHDDTGSGGVEQLAGAPDVMITNFDSIANVTSALHDGGIRWLNNTTGNFTKGYRLYDGDSSDQDSLGKAGGVGGNLVILSDPAPIEIGNRVWNDADSDGVQDPGELPIAGVTVRLYQGSTVVGTAVTDANGEYYFVSSTTADGNTGDNLGQVNGGILTATSYQVRLDNPSNYSIGGPLAGLTLTTGNQTSQLGDDDGSDSDALFVTNPAGSPVGSFPVVTVTTGSAGSNNHTFDIGFTSAPSAAPVRVEGRVLTASGAGIRNVMVYLTEADGTVHATVTSTFGYYRFTGISAGQSALIDVRSKRFTFSVPTRVVSLEDNLTGIDFFANQP